MNEKLKEIENMYMEEILPYFNYEEERMYFSKMLDDINRKHLALRMVMLDTTIIMKDKEGNMITGDDILEDLKDIRRGKLYEYTRR